MHDTSSGVILALKAQIRQKLFSLIVIPLLFSGLSFLLGIWPFLFLAWGICCAILIWPSQVTDQKSQEPELPWKQWLVGNLTAVIFTLLSLLFLSMASSLRRNIPALNLFSTHPVSWLFPKGSDRPLIPFSPGVAYFVAWYLHGFVVCQLFCFLQWRLGIALLLSAILSIVLLVPWIPGFLLGGLSFEPFLVPVLLLLFLGLLCRQRSTRAPATTQSLVLAWCPVVGALAWIVGCQWYRGTALPDPGPPIGHPEFLVRLEKAEKSPSGDRIGRALQQMPGDVGWISRDEWVEQNKLDRWFAGRWDEGLREAVAMPLGLLFNPRHSAEFPSELAVQIDTAGLLLSSRFLQQITEGNSRNGLRNLSAAFALSRHAQNVSVAWEPDSGGMRSAYSPFGRHYVEVTACKAVLEAIKRGASKTELLEIMMLLTEHERERPPLEDVVHTAYLSAWARIATVWKKEGWPLGEVPGESVLVQLSMLLPWERERAQRKINSFFHPPPTSLPGGQKTFSKSWGHYDWTDDIYGHLTSTWEEDGQYVLLQIRACQVQVAITLYVIDQGKAPDSLRELVPGYLPTLPQHPVEDRPLRIEDLNSANCGED